MSLTFERFTTLSDAREASELLAERSGNLFATWEWMSTWWRYFGAGRPLTGVIARRPGGDPAALVALYLSSHRPLRVLRFVGSGPSDWLGPVHAPTEEALAADAMHQALDEVPSWDVLLAERLRDGRVLPRGTSATLVVEEGFPILSFQGRSWEELLSGYTANLRRQIGKFERRLERSHRLAYRLSTDPDRLDDDLSVLFGLHQARWQQAGSGALDSCRQAFHRDFARLAQGRGWLRLWIMELDDQPVAAWYGFRFGGAEWSYQVGRDPARDRDSVGFVLTCQTIRAALNDGAHAYWFLRGAEPYKGRFTSTDPGVRTLLVAHGVRGRAARSIVARLDRLPETIRRRARTLAG